MKKILIVSTVSRQFYLFEQGNIEVLKSLGYEVHTAANFSDANERLNVLDIIRHPFDIQRSPFALKNIRAYKQLKEIMKLGEFDAVHCHSPMGGVLARLAARSVGISSVIYTAHGFHFYKGAPLVSWLIYYPIEKFLSRYTNVLITINKEDFERAQNFKVTKVSYVPGIGISTKKFAEVSLNRDNKRNELGIPQDSFVILSVGELNKNKNHEVVIRALTKIENSNVIYIICGQGERELYLKKLVKLLGINDKVILLGFRNDLSEIYKVADGFVFPSYREGLSMSLMEAMASGLPCVVSKTRGNVDLIEEAGGGYLCTPDDIDGFAKAINILALDSDLRNRMSFRNLEKLHKFDFENVKVEMKKIYENELL